MVKGEWNDAVPVGMDRLADRLSRVALAAGGVCFLLLAGLFATALVRDFSNAFVAFVGLVMVAVGTGVTAGVIRRHRRF